MRKKADKNQCLQCVVSRYLVVEEMLITWGVTSLGVALLSVRLTESSSREISPTKLNLAEGLPSFCWANRISFSLLLGPLLPPPTSHSSS